VSVAGLGSLFADRPRVILILYRASCPSHRTARFVGDRRLRIERQGGEFFATLVHSRGKTVLGLGCKDGVSRISTDVKDRQGNTLQRFETRQIRHWTPSGSGIIADVAFQRHSLWIRNKRQIPGLLKRLGLRRGDLAIGDVVTYEWHKMSNGARFGQALVEDSRQRTKKVVPMPMRPVVDSAR
jgi:hypothetical protein